MNIQNDNSVIQPKDQYYLACYIFFLLGLTINMPWFFVVDAQKYWRYKFRNVPSDYSKNADNSSELQNYFTSYLHITSHLPYSFFLIINVFISKWISIRIRVITTLLLILILFIITTVFVEIDTDKRQNEFLISTLTTASAGLNGADAVFAGTMFSVAGNFPSKYISSMSLGQAISGIFAAIFQILSLWLSTGPIATGLMYFLIGDFIIIFAFISYIFLEKQEFFKYHMKEKVTIKNSDKSIDDTPSSSDNNSVSYIKIIVKIWPYGLSIFLTFFITYLVYPGVNSLVKSESSSTSEWSDKYFVPVATFLTFSIGDYFGCLYSRYSSWLKGKPWLLLSISTARFIFIPIFFVCNASADSEKHFPVYITNDFIYMLIMFLFSTSHGFSWSSVFILVPTVVKTHEQEIASAMIGGFYGVGLSMSSLVSIHFLALL
ncbi:hypothetical protein HCN44_003960 [Aphidius gifuensis]|uniref:Equilibrative nucleoside transporter n=1 Tax=Aphidius gifuensis TaxID=684658 RepID=A0A835CUM7_APHGI|nr:hypothetical protein HCN44_003960 [Aphidius gifuensis]